ncbi:ABC transporter permease [Ornithinibacillus bavariensis]|uniref:FtsX-like permease family protein n=1 Tax=Ornithinibacillus bavariensis TaxID=545502 RepID=A0A920C5U8_9BACI|nr:FtsX-like permease family protein [Ornithinibacillus bavariensis]GIO25449.1 hypothetical protein J43TS3_00600 [Ornithinibacillus bavariensis]
MLSSFRVSWRNVTRHKKRFFFTLVAVVLGIAVMTSMLIAKETFFNLMDEQEQLTAGNADFRIKGNERFFSESELDGVLEKDELAGEVRILTKRGFVDMDTEYPEQTTVRFIGISNLQNGLIELPVKEGDITEEGLIITENAADLWNKNLGDKVMFQGMGSLTITAIVNEGGIINSPESMDEALFRDFGVIVPLKVLQGWTGMNNQISEYRFNVKNVLDKSQLLSSYQLKLEDTNLFVQPIVLDTQQYNDIEGMYFVFDLIAILSIFISAFIAFNMINTSIVERKKEISIMKSLGYTKGNVFKLVLKEVGFLAVLGTLFGLGIGIWLGFVVQDMLITAIVTQDIVHHVEIITPLITASLVGLIFPFIAAALPLYKAANTPILEAMFNKNVSFSTLNKLHIPRIILGVICTGIGLIDNVWVFLFLFVGLVLLFPLWMKIVQFVLSPILERIFGFSGKQAVRSIHQFVNRNANTAAMLAIGVSLALFMSAALKSLPEGMEDDIRETFGGDIIIEKETPWTDTDIQRVNGLADISEVYSYAEIPNVTWHTQRNAIREFSIISFSDLDGENMFNVIEKTDKNSEYPSIYVGERALQEWGGYIGDLITLNTPAGEGRFFVKGTVETSHYTSYVGFVEEAVVRDILNWPWNYHLVVDVAEEDSIPIILSGLDNIFGETIVYVDVMSSTIEQAKSGITGMNDLMQGLLLLVIAISAIGISNTLFMNTLERTRELGTMRALGFTKWQVRFMIMAEGLFIGITGVIVGTLYGILVVYLNAISKQAPMFLSFSIPWTSLALAMAGGIAFTLIASWLPSNSASRIPIKAAINYE